jgi:ElaB/YqjD/DUF883 family membrane-anchored ribosome-binding protein
MQLVEDLVRVLNDVDRLLHGLTDAGTQAAGDSIEHARQGIGQMRERLSDLRQRLQRELERSTKKADRTVCEHPFQSVAIAVAAGVIVGVLLTPRR